MTRTFFCKALNNFRQPNSRILQKTQNITYLALIKEPLFRHKFMVVSPILIQDRFSIPYIG